MPIDWTKPVETVEGIPVKIDRIVIGDQYPVKGTFCGTKMPWAIDGRYSLNGTLSSYNLRNVKEEEENMDNVVFEKRWVNLLSEGIDTMYKTKEEADAFAIPNPFSKLTRIACVEIDWPVVVKETKKKIKKEGWVNIYKTAAHREMFDIIGSVDCVFSTKEDAEKAGKNISHRVGCVHVEWEEEE